MLNPLFSLCVYFVEMVTSYIFFSSLCQPKGTTFKTVLAGGLLFSCASCVNILFRNNGVINGFATTFVNILFCFFASIVPCKKVFSIPLSFPF